MAFKQAEKIKQLLPPKRRILQNDMPITQFITNKKIKLTTNNNAFIFVVATPNNICLDYNNNRLRINRLLKQYTEQDNITEQFIKLIKEPKLINDKQTTLFIIEIIYITSILLGVDLAQFIDYISLNNLTRYYLILYEIHRNKYIKTGIQKQKNIYY